MAATVHQTPKLFTPSDNPIIWTFSSDQTAQVNFFYEVRVFVNGVEVSVENVAAENGINAKFDVSAWASNSCQRPELGDDTGYYPLNNNALFKIKITEFFGATPVAGATITTSEITAFKSRLEDQAFIDFDFTVYDTAIGGKVLSEFPEGLSYPKVRMNEQLRVAWTRDNAATPVLKIQVYDATDSEIATANTVAIPSLATTGPLFGLRLDPQNLIDLGLFVLADFDDATYYTFKFTGLDTNRVNIDRSCIYSKAKRVHFMSRIGAIESFTFSLISRISGKINHSGYQKQFGQWEGDQFVFDDAQGRDIDFATTTEKKIELTSDWLTEDEQNWLVNNCHTSPLAFIEEGVRFSDLKQRRITNTSFAEKIQENDMLFLEKITLQLPTITSATI